MKRDVTVSAGQGGVRPRAKTLVYPFTAIVGQEEMKLALLLNAIDASIGGVLIMGHRGTGKSTAVRALADLLPEIERVRDCLYGCEPVESENLCDDCFSRLAADGRLPRERAQVPVAELPLGATEDRVCGTLNIERALKEGVKAFEPGLLARANRGFLYIDEVNLLEDYLIDLLLDVAVTGRNLVEREGLSIEHPAMFRLIGSGNPEEGELRPQLLDRFGLHVEVKTASDVEERMQIVESREAYERDPAGFRARAENDQAKMRRRLVRARKNLQAVELPRELLRHIAELCLKLQIDGHRGELTIARAARAHAAFEGRKSVMALDVRRVATMALRHRLRRDPLEGTGEDARIEQHLDKLFPQNQKTQETVAAKGELDEDKPAPSSSGGGGNGGGGNGGGGGRAAARDAKAKGELKEDDTKRDAPPALDARLTEDALATTQRGDDKYKGKSQPSGGRAGAHVDKVYARRGRYVRATSTRTAGAKVALDATLRAAALDVGSVDDARPWRAGSRETSAASRLSIAAARNLRYKRFQRKVGTLFIFAIDASGSMALNRIAQAKGALVRLLNQSYVRRDRVALVSFRGRCAKVMLGPSGSAHRAKRALDSLGVGGATPLAAGLLSSLEIARRARRQNDGRIVLLVFTDGRANASLYSGETAVPDGEWRGEIERELKLAGAALRETGVATIIVDTQNRFTSCGEGQKLAELIGGSYAYLPSSPFSGERFTPLINQARRGL